MSNNCKHPTCYDSEVCRRQQKEKKVYALNRTALKRSTTPIRKVSLTNKKIEKADDSWTNLRDDLDTIISLYVRVHYSNCDGVAKCYTCDKEVPYKEGDCSHFIPRAHIGTRFSLDNLRFCCKKCNQVLDGNLSVFAARLEEERPGTVEWLKEQGRQPLSLSVSDLRDLIIEYRHKLKIAMLKFK